jgi:glutathione S-transferase
MCNERCDPFFEYLENTLWNNSTNDVLVGDSHTIADYVLYCLIIRLIKGIKYGEAFKRRTLQYISKGASDTNLVKWYRRINHRRERHEDEPNDWKRIDPNF